MLSGTGIASAGADFGTIPTSATVKSIVRLVSPASCIGSGLVPAVPRIPPDHVCHVHSSLFHAIIILLVLVRVRQFKVQLVYRCLPKVELEAFVTRW